MTGIQDLLSASDEGAFQYDPAQRYLEEHCRPTPASMASSRTPTLPSLSVLMQPRMPLEHSHHHHHHHHHTSRTQGCQGHHSQQHQHQHQQQFYSTPASQQVPYYAPVSPSASGVQNWSPASATSSVGSATDSPFPIRRQTFYTREHSPTHLSHSHHHHHSHQQYYNQREQHTWAPPCTCGCDPASSDDEAMTSVTRYPAVATIADSQRDQKPTISSSSKSSSENVESGESSATAAGAKKSRYLREMDRRAILARLDKGEKQSVLAKEYNVSRSSICNLFKHRDEVLSRVNQNPFTKHPKKPKPAASVVAGPGGGIANRATEKLITCVKAIYSPFSQTNNGVAMETDMIVDTTGRVHRVNSRAASVLLQILDKPDLSASEFRRCANQIMLLLVEEALAMLPALAADASGMSRMSLSPLLSITMEQANQHAMLDVFHSIEPNCPRGYVQFERSQWHQDVKIKLLDAQLSSALSNHNVLLLDVAVTSPSMVAFVIESLLRNGALESKITVVAVFVARAVVELVQSKFPAVRIIATDFESGHALDQRGAMPRSVLFKHRLEHMYSEAI